MSTAQLTAADLRPVDLFDDLDDDELAVWAAAAEPFDVAPGEVLLEPAEPARGLLLLLEGSARTLLVGEGREERLGRQEAPTWIGAIAALTEGSLGVRMQAESACRLARIPAPRFTELALSTPAVHRRIMRQISPVMTRLTAIEQNRERLASLGTMAAGLAHELNNPAAAAKRAASDLVDALETVSGTIRAFVEAGISREDAERLVHLHDEALARGGGQSAPRGLDAADAEDEMLQRLEDLGVPEAWRLAEPLASAGLDGDWLRQVATLAGPATGQALRWVAASLTAHNLACELLDSAERMGALVGAVKTYAYMDRGGLVEADLHEGLDSTLVILGHKLKHTRISVVRDYDPALSKLTVRGSELNQVWTNLIHNAIDALGDHGTITLRTRLDGDCVQVDVADDGPGIPEDARARVLEPFYTTKAVGSGTGLGLDTARRIVEEGHGGSISFDTSDAGTTFQVRLPLRGDSH
jgi:signal transduction histidine kinase